MIACPVATINNYNIIMVFIFERLFLVCSMKTSLTVRCTSNFVSQALDTMLVSEGLTCIERNIPVMCYGNQNDMKVSLLMDSDEGRISISTQVNSH